MPTIIDETKYFRTAEVQRLVGISRNTLFNWLKEGTLGKFELRDRHGWRLFTKADIEILQKKANHINIVKCAR
jgi:DNA-binding transcriptional MerR regulator